MGRQYDGSGVLGQGYPRTAVNDSMGMFVAGPWSLSHDGNDVVPNFMNVARASVYLNIAVCNTTSTSFPRNVTGGVSVMNDCGVFKIEDAWHIDTKVDDGMPSAGKMLAQSMGMATKCTITSATPRVYNVAQGSVQACNLLVEMVL
jgi:hypothetical protein